MLTCRTLSCHDRTPAILISAIFSIDCSFATSPAVQARVSAPKVSLLRTRAEIRMRED